LSCGPPHKWLRVFNRGKFSYERSGIDPDFRERSPTKRFVPATALSLFFGIEKNFDPSSFSHVTPSLFTKWRYSCRKY